MTRSRPIDASGLFWALISLVVGLGLLVFSPMFLIVLVAIPFCWFWQLRKWRKVSTIAKEAREWCERHFPKAGNASIVDFMIALVHDVGIELQDCSPETCLERLNWMSEDDQAEYWYPDHQERNRQWLRYLLSRARIRVPDLSKFSGSTLRETTDLVLDLKSDSRP